MTTTIETLELDQIKALSTEAAQAGDTDMVRDCELVAANYHDMFCALPDSGIPAEQWAAADRIVATIRNAEAQVG